MRLMRVRRVVAPVACAVAVISFAQTAHADVGPGADVIAGTSLPPLPDVQQNNLGLEAAPGYVADNDSQDEYDTDLLTVHRLSDGAAVRDLTYSSSDRSFPPRLSGDAVTRIVPATNVTPAQFVVDDLVTGEERSRTSVPSGDGILADTAAGLLLRRGSDLVSPTTEYVLEPDGRQIQVGAPQSSWRGVFASDATTVVQQVWNRLWAIDVASGQYHDVGTADFISRAYLTPHRIFWATQNYSSGPTTATMHRTDRDGGNPDSATFVPSVPVRDYVPLGDELLAEVLAGGLAAHQECLGAAHAGSG